MRDLLLQRPLHRVKGRAALIRRAQGLLLAVHRFGRGRATSPDDLKWAARAIDQLTTLLADAPTATTNHHHHQSQEQPHDSR
jgi:hypothetical protein